MGETSDARGPALAVRGLSKSFTLHLQDGARIDVVGDVAFAVFPGECVVLAGPSGVGKSSILKMIAGNYAISAGSVVVSHRGGRVDLAGLDARRLAAVRREAIGYVSQFLRVVPRVPAIDVVAEPLLRAGAEAAAARRRAGDLLARLNVPERLWALPPATFSGGEKQRVNIARGFARPAPILLLDEPTASLDADNRTAVVALAAEARAAGCALLGIFHDRDVREALADRIVDVAPYSAAA